jgi:hypothetical protein
MIPIENIKQIKFIPPKCLKITYYGEAEIDTDQCSTESSLSSSEHLPPLASSNITKFSEFKNSNEIQLLVIADMLGLQFAESTNHENKWKPISGASFSILKALENPLFGTDIANFLGSINPSFIELAKQHNFDDLYYVLSLHLSPQLVDYVDNPGLFTLLANLILRAKKPDYRQKRYKMLSDLLSIKIGKSDLKLLKKINFNDCDIPLKIRNKIILKTLTNTDIKKTLRHRQSIKLNSIDNYFYVLANAPSTLHILPIFSFDSIVKLSRDEVSFLIDIVIDIIRMNTALPRHFDHEEEFFFHGNEYLGSSILPDLFFKQGTSLESLTRLHDQTAKRLQAIKSAIIFPEPILPADERLVHHIRSSEELRDEGKEMNHCCFSYMFEIANGFYDFYKFKGKERGTFAVVRNSKPTIHQFYGESNEAMSPDSWNQLTDWFLQTLEQRNKS